MKIKENYSPEVLIAVITAIALAVIACLFYLSNKEDERLLKQVLSENPPEFSISGTTSMLEIHITKEEEILGRKVVLNQRTISIAPDRLEKLCKSQKISKNTEQKLIKQLATLNAKN
ncbi:MAG: hypothetical protein EBR40_00110 [Proteobacteria bacterium]|nr:hypothetical protein [Pseudomonadota bacterium]